MRWPRRPAAGLGGCPLAPRTTGNIAIEDLVYLLQGMGVADLPGLAALLEVNRWVAERLGGEAIAWLGGAGRVIPGCGVVFIAPGPPA